MVTRIIFGAAVILVLLTAAASGATVRRMSFEELLLRSDCVVYGVVMSARSYLDSPTGNIWTETEIKVLDGPKGQPGNKVMVVEPGGVLGEIAHVFPGVPRFSRQQEVVVFLYSAGVNRFRVTGLRQGMYSVAEDKATGTRMVVPDIQERETVFIGGTEPASKSKSAPANDRRLDQFLNKIRTAAK